MTLVIPAQQQALLLSMQTALIRKRGEVAELEQQLAGAARMTIQVVTEGQDTPADATWDMAADCSAITLRGKESE